MKHLKLNLKKMVKLRGVALVLVASTAVLGLTGCGKQAECSIEGSHAHKYVNDSGYIRYIDKEYLSYEGFDRTEEYISFASSEEDLYRFYDAKDLMLISDNLDLVLQQQEKNQDFVEYRYSYTSLLPIPHTMHIGKTTTMYFTYIPTTRHSWTTDSNHDRLTGEQRLCHYVYTAYKVEKDEKGNFVLVPSPEVDDITTVMDEYPYITTRYYKKIDVELGEDLDYEDGPAEEDEYYDKEKDVPIEGEVEEQAYVPQDEEVKKLILNV